MWDALGGIYCINLYSRPDRYAQAQQVFQDIGISDKVKWFQTHKLPGSDPCKNLLNNYHAIFTLESPNPKPIAVFEDDITLSPEFFSNAESHQITALFHPANLPAWDTIRLGHRKGVCFAAAGIPALRWGNAVGTHAVIYSPKFRRWMLEHPQEWNDQMDRVFARVSWRHLLLTPPMFFSDPELGTDNSIENPDYIYTTGEQYHRAAEALWEKVRELTVADRLSILSRHLAENKHKWAVPTPDNLTENNCGKIDWGSRKNDDRQKMKVCKTQQPADKSNHCSLILPSFSPSSTPTEKNGGCDDRCCQGSPRPVGLQQVHGHADGGAEDRAGGAQPQGALLDGGE